MAAIATLTEFLLWLQPEATGGGGASAMGGGGGGSAPPMDGCAGSNGTLLMLLGMFAFMYFVIMRPEQKRAKEREATLKSLLKGDMVRTNGGILGEIVRFENDDRDVILEIAPKTRINVFRTQILGKETAPSVAEGKKDAGAKDAEAKKKKD